MKKAASEKGHLTLRGAPQKAAHGRCVQTEVKTGFWQFHDFKGGILESNETSVGAERPFFFFKLSFPSSNKKFQAPHPLGGYRRFWRRQRQWIALLESKKLINFINRLVD